MKKELLIIPNNYLTIVSGGNNALPIELTLIAPIQTSPFVTVAPVTSNGTPSYLVAGGAGADAQGNFGYQGFASIPLSDHIHFNVGVVGYNTNPVSIPAAGLVFRIG